MLQNNSTEAAWNLYSAISMMGITNEPLS